MPDLTSQILPRLEAHERDALPLTSEMIFPHYQGLSTVNLPGTVTRLLGVPDFGQPPLDDAIFTRLNGSFNKVLFLLVDALGVSLLDRLINRDPDLLWGRLRDRGIYSPLTSICPSTTASALTTLWTGEAPATHGIIGYEMWAKEFGMVINNILHAPASARGDVGGLDRSGFDPHEFLGLPLLGSHLRQHGVTPTTFIHSGIANSGLSVMQLEDVDVKSYVDEADACISLANFLNGRQGDRDYVYMYYSDVDTLMHRFSALDDRVAFQFGAFSNLFQHAFLDRLSKQVAKETLLILTADHGSQVTPINPRYDLNLHPELMDCLIMPPTCEHRLAFFYIKTGKVEEARDYFARTWPEEFLLLDPEVALTKGLFGDGVTRQETPDRLGDLIAVAKGDAYLWWAPTPNHMAGRHGGLSRDEMLVPFLAMPLEDLAGI